MHTCAKQKHVASDRARRPNVPKHILFRYIGKGCIKNRKRGNPDRSGGGKKALRDLIYLRMPKKGES